MEDEITLEQLIARHQQRAQDIMTTMARDTRAKTAAGNAHLNGEIPPSSGAPVADP
jgi:hypothetical protein